MLPLRSRGRIDTVNLLAVGSFLKVSAGFLAFKILVVIGKQVRFSFVLGFKKSDYLEYKIPTSVVSLDMARHPCPWEVKVSDPGRERVYFFTRPRLGEIRLRMYLTYAFLIWTSSDPLRCLRSSNIRWFFGTMCPHDDAFLLVPRFPLLRNSGGDYQSVYMRLTLTTGDGLWECLRPCLLLGSVQAVGIFDSKASLDAGSSRFCGPLFLPVFNTTDVGIVESPQSSMILPADHVLRAVINARLPVPLLLLVCFWSYLFHAVMLPYQVGDVPLTCIAAVDYVSGIHVASSDYWISPIMIGRCIVQAGCTSSSCALFIHMGLLDAYQTANTGRTKWRKSGKKDDQIYAGRMRLSRAKPGIVQRKRLGGSRVDTPSCQAAEVRISQLCSIGTEGSPLSGTLQG
ncbi:hypothetical protein Tco_0272561 [Tanacetum coccineum]